ncbi:MAG TPA: hypothetical protein VF633_08195 [Brevundimonas sp.]|jgi:hypothetical protein
MTDRITPVSAVTGGTATPGVTRVGDRRGSERRSAERRAKDEAKKQVSTSRELVPVGKVVDNDPAGPAARKTPRTRAEMAAAAFAAQMLGQGGQRNGIKGGPPVMDNARSTYLGAQYSGEHERRPPVGTNTRKDV